MTIQLFDLDVPYNIDTNVTSEGKDVVEIRPLSQNLNRDEDYNIVLDYDRVQELIRVLQFVSNEIKPKDQPI